uniref:Uncharacterized protein n=2 Tax=Lutzomyia longipalpis TaxID=7200 RepID=A0A1B0CMF7_LUTLO
MRILCVAIIGFMWLVPRVSLFQTDYRVNGATEEQLREIQQLRNELDVGDAPRASGKSLVEADAIREEIMNAVKNRHYVHGSEPKSQLLNAAHLWGSLGNLFKRRRVAANQGGGDEEIDPEVESSDFHIHFPHLSQMYRDVLELDSVEEDMSFDLGDNVVYWKTLQPRKIGKHALVGITNSSVVLLKETEGHYEFIRELELPSKPTCLEGFVQWDAEDEAAEGIVLVAIANELLWIDLGTNFSDLTISWRWSLHKNLTEVDFFSLMEEPMVIVISEPSTPNGRTSADIYRFDYTAKDFWLVQTIPLAVPSTSVAVLEDSTNLVIGIPQQNITVLYKYLKESSFNRHFVHFMDIESPDVAHVASFRIGGNSHLAIGGSNPQIWRLEDENLESVEIRHNHFGLVDFWLPIVATTYRDDLIVLVQHRVQLQTHKVTKLEVLVWNGEFFSSLLNVPCILSDIQSQFGISCMLDFDRERGLEGSTIIRHGKNISILVPRDDADSGLFVLNMQMRASYHPEQEHFEEFRMMYDYFSTLSDYKDHVLEEALDGIKNAVKLNEFNAISAHWTVGSLETPVFEVASDEAEFGEDYEIAVGEKLWTLEDSMLDIPTISETIGSIEKGVDELINYAVERARNNANFVKDSPSINLGSIFSNGRFSTEGIYILDSKTNQMIAATTENDARVKRNSNSSAVAKELIVKYLEVDSINGIPTSNLIFSGNDKITIESDLVIDGPLEVEEDVQLRGKVNGKFLHEEAIETESETYYRDILEFDSLHINEDLIVQESVNGMDLVQFSQVFITPALPEDVIADENITIDDDFTFKTINGINWEQFISRIVMTNLPISLGKIKVNGEVSFMDDSTVDMINNITFPEGFLWAWNGTSDEPLPAVVTGHKKFKTLVASLVDAEHMINDVIVDNVITLNSIQTIPGETTFNHLEVVGGLEASGKVYGKHLDDILENPTLNETRHVRSACIFRDLRVEGNIIVNDSINGVDFHNLLRDAVYRTDETINVTSFKSFNNVIINSGITLTSSLLNGVPLKEFVTKDSEQELHIRELNGDIYFHSLDLDGLFNTVNVTELDYDAIKLSGQQHTEAEIIFENDDLGDFVDVLAGNMEIADSINGFKMHDLIDTTMDFELNADVEFEKLRVDQLDVHGGMNGEYLVNDINLGDFDRRRLSLSREQIIDAPFHIEYAQIEMVNVSSINNFSIDHVESLLRNAENLEEVIKSGKVPIETLTVRGDVYLEMVNGKNFTSITGDAIWLNETNTFGHDVKFLDKINFLGDLSVEGKLNGENFELFLQNIIQRSHDPIILAGRKTFKKTLHVAKGIQVDYINDLHVDSMLIQNRSNVINGDLSISGNLTVKKLNFLGKINGYPITHLMDLYSYDPSENLHHIHGDVHFYDHPYVHHLVVDGSLNNLDHITEYMEGILLHTQRGRNITGKKIFRNDVFFDNTLKVGIVNGIDFQDFVDNVVLIDKSGYSADIHGSVTFLNGLVEAPEVFVQQNLIAHTIMGCSLHNLIGDAVWTDRDLELPLNITFGPGALLAESIESDSLNGIPMSKFITLHTEQEIEETLVVPDVLVNQPISVDGFVNGVKLPEERENTLMIFGDQTVETSVSFQQARILNSLITTGLVNNQNIRNVALLSSDLMIKAPVSFDYLEVENVFTEHLISGINFTKWHDSVLWRSGKDNQTVTGQWVFKNCHIEEALDGRGTINKIDFVHMMTHLKGNPRKLAEKLEHTEKLYVELCRKIMNERRGRHDICFFRYFEPHYSIWEKGEKITSHRFYENNGQSFFIYSAGCHSRLHQWDPTEKRFNLLGTINTGQIDEWIHVEDALGDAHLVANGPANPKCNESGSAVWKWTGANLVRVTHMDQRFKSLIGNALRPGHFYAIDSGNVVTEYDLRGKSGEKWKPSLGATSLKFIPQEVNLGLAVTDGKRIKVIQDKQMRRRRRIIRATDSSAEDITVANDDSDDSFVNLLKKYSEILKSNASVANESFEDFSENEIVGDKLFDQFQDLMKEGSKAFIDTTFELIEMLKDSEEKGEEKKEEGSMEYVGEAASNATDPADVISKEEFLNTLRHVLAKKMSLIQIAMGALSEKDHPLNANATLTVITINGTSLKNEDFEDVAEDAIDLWLMELLMNDKINEIVDDMNEKHLPKVHVSHTLQKLNTSTDTSEGSSNVSPSPPVST